MLRIGYIGLGLMRKSIARNILKAGFPVVVHNRSRGAVEELVAEGAVAAASAAEVARKVDVVFTNLPDSPDVEKVALGENGLIEAARSGLIYIDMRTIAPAVAQKVAAILGTKGVRCLDAPVSGGETGALHASLSIMVGGDEGLFREMLPIFEVMGKTITYCGKNGAGQTVKACNQIQVAMNFIGLAEALVLGTKAGVDPAVILKVLQGGYAQTRVMDVRGPKIIKGEFEPGFKSKLHFKDLNIIMDTARELKVPLPASTVAHELFSAMLSSGRGELDHSAVIQVLEDMAGVEARSRQ